MKAVTSRIAAQSGTEAASSSSSPAASSACSAWLRAATEGAWPSSRSRVSATASRPSRVAIAAGRWAAPDTSWAELIAWVMAASAAWSDRPCRARLQTVSGRGRTLRVISLSTASVPWEPVRSLGRS